MFVFYDTETTGLSRDFDQILQFAAILTDNDLVERERFNIRGRCLPWVVPAPAALNVTAIAPALLDDPALPGFYDMICTVRAKLAAWSPAIFIGYNSMRFDEPMLQRAFWQALLPPYLTVTDGNARMDVLPLVRAASHLSPDTLSIPVLEDGSKVFRLDRLAPANGFKGAGAHDALADVEATIHLAGRLATREPALWQGAVARAPKAATASLLEPGRPVLVVEYFSSGPSLWWGQRIDAGGAKPTRADIARLAAGWSAEAASNDERLGEFLSASRPPLRTVGLNKAPLVYSEAEARDVWGEVPGADERAESVFLSGAPDFCARVLGIRDARKPDWPPPLHLEQQIFEGFPGREDERRMRAFQSSDWTERGDLVRTFDDQRLRQLAQRLVFAHAPQVMAQADRTRIARAVAARLHADHADQQLWRTLAAARRELAELAADGAGEAFCRDVQVWLDARGAQFPQP